jgi:predicted PurR-regulated permease PerM
MGQDDIAVDKDADHTGIGLGDRFRLYALAGLTVVFVGLCLWLAIPFLPAITWGVALAIIAWPMHRWIRKRVGRPRLAAMLSSIAVVLAILVPAVLVTYHLAQEAAATAARVQDQTGEGGLREKIDAVPALNRLAQWMDRIDLDIETEARKLVASYTQDVTNLAQGSVSTVLQFLIAMFILYYLFLDRSEFVQGTRDLLPLSRAESDRVFARAADSVHANLYATLVTSLIDATGGGLMFWALGLPAPLLWAVVMFVLSILPIVGTGFIWIPAAIYLALTGRWIAAAALVAWGVLSFLITDNVIYVRLAGERMRLHDVPALIAFLGGLALFGMSGMILGPAILAVTVALLEVWKGRLAARRSSEV